MKKNQNTNIDKNVEELEFSLLVEIIWSDTTTIENSLAFSYYLKINLPDNPASLLQDIFPRELKYGSTQNFNVSFPSSFILSSELGTVQMSINKWTDKQFLVKNVMHWLIT